jgi:hypothetical protein
MTFQRTTPTSYASPRPGTQSDEPLDFGVTIGRAEVDVDSVLAELWFRYPPAGAGSARGWRLAPGQRLRRWNG